MDLDVRKVPGTTLRNQGTGAVVYTPPEGQPRLRELLANWEAFLHEDDEPVDFDPVKMEKERIRKERREARKGRGADEPLA